MKKIVKSILYLLIVITITSCTDLKENVYNKLPMDKFGSTQEEMDAIIGPAYTSLKNAGSYDRAWGWADMAGDIMIAPTRVGGDWWDGGEYMEQCMHTWTARSLALDPLWDSCMGSITTINSIYSIVEPNTLMSPELKAQILGELRGLRAFWYYQLVDYFGNVPIVTDYKSTDLPTIKPRKEVYNFVVNELKEIIPALRSDVSDASYGKFTKGAAYTVLAKMCLNAQEWTGTTDWEGVIAACDNVMALDYIIEPNWKINFDVHNEVSREIILPICYSKNDNWDTGGNMIHLFTLHYQDPIALGFKADTWNGLCAMPDFVKSFDDADKRKEGTFLIGPMIDPATGQVLITSVGRPLIHTVDLNVLPGSSSYPAPWGEVNQEDGARINKWVFEKGMMNTFMENDLAIFRLADVYLMKAEALVRLGRDNAEATRLVNVIRERGFGNSDHNYSNVTLKNIYDERGFELAFEFCRRQDMIRFGTFLLPRFMKPEVTPEYRKLLPIPFTAWQKNNNLVQNPGYPGF